MCVTERFKSAAAVPHGRMHRRLFRDRNAQDRPQPETVRATPIDAALAVQAFEVANQHHPKINSGRNAGPASFFIIGRAELLDSAAFVKLNDPVSTVEPSITMILLCAILTRIAEQLPTSQQPTNTTAKL